MTDSRGCILWDFHGTLAARSWSATLWEILQAEEPTNGASRKDIGAHLQGGYPWHQHERPHPELNDPQRWWALLEALMTRAYEGIGVAADRARELATLARARYIDPTHYEVYDDTRPALEALRDEGWRHWILSNHVPELPDIVTGLGLRDLFEDVLTSATLGFDKPHPGLFAIAQERVGPVKTLWMVGDNIEADIHGAQACGIPAILVRERHHEADRQCDDLHGVAALLSAGA